MIKIKNKKKGKQLKQEEMVSIKESERRLSQPLSFTPGAPSRYWVILGAAVFMKRWKARVYCLVLSSFSSSMSLREALTLLETSFPWEKRRWRSLKVRLSGAPLGIEFSCSWLKHTHARAKCMLYQYTEPTVLHKFSMNAVNTFFYYFVATWVIRAKTHYYCWITNTGCRVQNTGQFIRLNQQCVNLFGLEGKKMFKFKKMPWFGLKNNEAPVEFK